MWPFTKAKPITHDVNEIYRGETVTTHSNIKIGAVKAARMLDALSSIDKDPELKTRVFPILYDLSTEQDVPLEIIGLVDDIIPDHGFFEGDKMDIFTKSFLSGALLSIDGQVELDISYYDEQIRQINHRVAVSQKAVDAFVRDLK